jgi:DnaJ-class molecular chaperone
MEYKNYYRTLGVSKGATSKEIKAAFRRLARKHHPDVNPNDKQAEARFKEVNEAYEVLSDPEKRKRYDTLGANWAAYESGANVPPWGPGRHRVRVNVSGSGGEGLGGFSEFFRTFFGGGGFTEGVGGFGGELDVEDLLRARSGQQVADLEGEIELALEDVLHGTSRTLRGGKSREVEVKIPPGVRDGSRIRVSGEGRASGGRAGDLYLRVRVLPHARFTRQEDDLATTVRIPLTLAVLGGDIEVPTLDGRVGLKVPPGTPAGRVLRAKGQGLPRSRERGARGDLLVALQVALPTAVSGRERELFEELRRLGH